MTKSELIDLLNKIDGDPTVYISMPEQAKKAHNGYMTTGISQVINLESMSHCVILQHNSQTNGTK